MLIRLESPDQPEILKLIDELDKYQRPLYPANSFHGVDLRDLMRPEVLFAVARNDDGHAVGCGAIAITPEYGEVKRMFVRPSVRGQGIGGQLLAFLEERAKTRGCANFVLETGYLQTGALSLYRRSGYVRCPAFGPYSEDPNSVFMCKSTAP